MLNRQIYSILSNAKRSILLLGPRQTGKSTLIRSLKPELEINLADEETFIAYLSDPGLLKAAIRGHRRIFIDEVQRIPSLLNTVQFLIDDDKKLQFYLSGSSARKLKRGKANLLPGRLLSYALGPLNLFELAKNFEIERAMSCGLLPGIYLEEDAATAQKLLKTYSATYLKEEIQAESLTRNLEGFSRFFNVVAARSGQYIDFAKFASHADIERMSASRYYEILCDTLVVHGLDPFVKSSKRRFVQHPKYYFFDVGVLNACLENFVASPDRVGMIFEHLVLQLLVSGAHAKDESIRISTYRTEQDVEVDFIVELKNELFAIEVKHTNKIGQHDLRGLKNFAEFYGKKHRAMVIYRGARPLTIDGIDVLPLEEAMRELGFA